MSDKKTNRSYSDKYRDVDACISDFSSKDGRTRVVARKALVEIGHSAVPKLVEALQHSRQSVRWEAAKSLGEIGDPTSVDALIAALKDTVFDVQWLAAEALINIGANSVKPLLRALVQDPDSDDIRVGAHHVFHDLRTRDYDDILRPVIVSLEDTTLTLSVPLEAEKALDKL